MASKRLINKLVRIKDPSTLQGEGSDQLTSGLQKVRSNNCLCFATNSILQVLTTVDLTSLGVGSCVGTGMYLVSGMVAHNVAGPGVIFSFVIAATASILSGTPRVLSSIALFS